MASEILFDPSLPAFRADPYPFYRRLREVDPVHESPLGFWVLTRLTDCMMALRDPRFDHAAMVATLDAVYGGPKEPNFIPRAMVFEDPPNHTRLRSLVNHAFTPRIVEGLRPRIHEIVGELIDRAEPSGRMDVIGDFAYTLAVTVVSELLGVPKDDQGTVKQWSADIARSLDAIDLTTDPEVTLKGRTSRLAMAAYFRALLPERRKNPRADLLSLLVAAEEQGDKLSEGELLVMCILLYVAGHETSVNLIGNGLLALLRHPDQLARWRADPALAGTAVEELLRYTSPVARAQRVTNTDVEIDGRVIPKGAKVVVLIAAANRDPAHFTDPERLDIERRDNRHMAFGYGIHFCLGAPLARIEGHIALETLIRRLPRLALVGPEPAWRASQMFRGLEALPVTF